jgi:hypothetical protein
METKLRRPPILLNEVELAVIFRVKITYVSTRLNQLLKLGLLRDKIRLQKQYAPATAISAARGTTNRTLGKKILFRPQSTLPDDDLHALEPAGHGGVVFSEIE